jgi:hypothetical protein
LIYNNKRKTYKFKRWKRMRWWHAEKPPAKNKSRYREGVEVGVGGVEVGGLVGVHALKALHRDRSSLKTSLAISNARFSRSFRLATNSFSIF